MGSAHERVLVLDFGSQYTQLIARRIREAHVYSEILPYNVPLDRILDRRPGGLIFSGGPASVYDRKAPSIPAPLLEAGIPILGICYRMQLVTHVLGGKVARAAAGVDQAVLYDGCHCGHPGPGSVREGVLRAQRRCGLLGGRGAYPPRRRRPSHVPVRRSRALAARGSATGPRDFRPALQDEDEVH